MEDSSDEDGDEGDDSGLSIVLISCEHRLRFHENGEYDESVLDAIDSQDKEGARGCVASEFRLDVCSPGLLIVKDIRYVIVAS